MRHRAEHARHPDPMREIDLLLLEDDMTRRDVEIDTRSRVAQTVALLLVATFFLGILVHSLTRGDAGLVASLPSIGVPLAP
jgi:hypothetical protein